MNLLKGLLRRLVNDDTEITTGKQFLEFISAVLNSFNVVKNMLLQPVVQVGTLTTSLTTLIAVKTDSLTLLDSFIMIIVFVICGTITYLFLAWLSYKFKVRKGIEKEDYKNTYVFPEIFKRFDAIDKKLTFIEQDLL